MRAVVQLVQGASVSVAGGLVGEFAGAGLVVFVGVTHGDTREARRGTFGCSRS